MFDKITVRLFNDNATLRLLKIVDDEGALDTAAEPLPTNDEEEAPVEGNGVDSEEEEEKF